MKNKLRPVTREAKKWMKKVHKEKGTPPLENVMDYYYLKSIIRFIKEDK